jgi:hypothetical protein
MIRTPACPSPWHQHRERSDGVRGRSCHAERCASADLSNHLIRLDREGWGNRSAEGVWDLKRAAELACGEPLPPTRGAREVVVSHAPGPGAASAVVSSGPWVGNVTLKVEPRPSVLVTVIVPPCRSTSARVMARPNPVPPTPWVVSCWARKKGVKSCAWSSGDRPIPVSCTLTRTRPSSPRAVMVMLPSGGVYL